MALTPAEIDTVLTEANIQLHERGGLTFRMEHPFIPPDGFYEALVSSFFAPADEAEVADVVTKIKGHMTNVLSQPDPLLERAKRAFRAYFERINPPGSVLPEWDDAPSYIQAAWLAAVAAAQQ